MSFKRKAIAVGGVAASAAGLGAVRKRVRYLEGESKVQQVVDGEPDGLIVILQNGVTFWVPENMRTRLDVYRGGDAPALPYRVDRFRPRANGLLPGEIAPAR